MSEYQELHDNFVALKQRCTEKEKKQLKIERLERIIARLGSYSDCKDCNGYITQLNACLEELSNLDTLDKLGTKQLRNTVQSIIGHFGKEHKLISEGHYMSTYMSIGLSLGVVFGMLLFDNLAIGISVGMCMGIAIGTSLDADAKKKDKTI